MHEPTRSSPWWQKSLLTLLGGVFVLAGIVMLVIPGPGWLTILAGVAIWAREYHWARRLLKWLKLQLQRRLAPLNRAPKE